MTMPDFQGGCPMRSMWEWAPGLRSDLRDSVR